MKRTSLVAALVACLALAVGPAAAAPGNGTHGIWGTGWRIQPAASEEEPGLPRVEFKVAVVLAPGKVLGTYEYANNIVDVSIIGSATCGAVDGNVAVVGGSITGGNTSVGDSFLMFFVDNGTPTFGSVGPDEVSWTLIPEPGDEFGTDFPDDFPTSCPAAQGDTFQQQQAQEHGMLPVLGDLWIH